MYPRFLSTRSGILYPRSFGALMDMYEQNYIRVRCLCPDLDKVEHAVSKVAGPAHDLYLNVLERSRHTTTLQLTYQMSDGTWRPDVTVRIYHDALQAEVLSGECRLGERMEIDRSPTETALMCRWRLNRFLYKWLGYCLRQGHGFGSRAPDLQGNVKPTEILHELSL
jgi:uncharacterized protein YqiB (DUF1249 family)